jgi:hypothetical protein
MPGILRFVFLSLFVPLLFPVFAHSFELPPPEQFHNGLSLQGFTGILNTPSAHVTEEGFFYALYSNQKESKWRDQATSYQDNYLFSVGFFSFAEIGGRLFDAPGIGRDLSANLKLSSEPFFRNYPHAPVLAVGLQDIGGGSTFFDSKYAVLSEDLWRFRFSAGYAGLGTGPFPTRGAFAGAEFKAHDWVYLLSEYDTRETNLGVRVVTPQFCGFPISFTATAKTSLDHKPGNFDLAVGLNLPLDFKVRSRSKAAQPSASAMVVDSQPTAQSPSASQSVFPSVFPSVLPSPSVVMPRPAAVSLGQTAPPSGGTASSSSQILGLLRGRLIDAGFINVRVGSTTSGVLVIEYENVRFNHNELDAVGVVGGLALSLARDRFDLVRLIIKRHDISMVQLTMPLATLDGYLQGTITQSAFNDSLQIDYHPRVADAHFPLGKGNPGFLTSSLMLYPGLTTFVGTEFGVFDYLLSVKPDLLVDAWKGAVVNARWDIPVAWSDNLDDGKPYRNARHDARLERLMLFQAFKPAADLMLNLGAGLVLPHDYGTLNEATWSPGNGSHRFRALQAYAKDHDTQQTTTAYLGSYRYYFSPLDLALEGTGGRFWAQDTGFALELKRFFGDATVSVYYKNSQREDSKRWKAAGIQFSFPLTLRKDMKPYHHMQVRGTDEWSYSQETTLGHRNDLAPYPLAINPQPTTALYRAYYNRDRLSEDYIRGHWERVREAWLKYANAL